MRRSVRPATLALRRVKRPEEERVAVHGSPRRPLALVPVILLAAVTGACGSRAVYQAGSSPQVVGSGTVVSEERTVEDFSVVGVSSVIQAEVPIGSPLSVRVSADDNILPLVKSSASSGRLLVGISGSMRTSNPIKVTIVTPDLSAVIASASAVVRVASLATDRLQVRGDGAADIRVSGSADVLMLHLAGASKATLTDLAVTSATVDLQASSRADITVSGSVAGSVATASLLTVGGNPTMTVTTTTAGEVKER